MAAKRKVVGNISLSGERSGGQITGLSFTKLQLIGPSGDSVTLWDREESERARAAARRIYRIGRKVQDAASEGGDARAGEFKEPRRRLWKLWLSRQPVGFNQFCRDVDREEPDGIYPVIVGYENIRHHLRVAKGEHGAG